MGQFESCKQTARFVLRIRNGIKNDTTRFKNETNVVCFLARMRDGTQNSARINIQLIAIPSNTPRKVSSDKSAYNLTTIARLPLFCLIGNGAGDSSARQRHTMDLFVFFFKLNFDKSKSFQKGLRQSKFTVICWVSGMLANSNCELHQGPHCKALSS